MISPRPLLVVAFLMMAASSGLFMSGQCPRAHRKTRWAMMLYSYRYSGE